MANSMEKAEVPLNRDVFCRKLLRDLSGTLEEMVGLEAAEGYISTVGGQIGDWIDQAYREATGAGLFDRSEVAAICIDLKRRIGGDFYLIEADEEKLVFGNRACPFGEMVKGRRSLCMMTSNVFGRISADNLGYASVHLEETIAAGAQGCRVVVYLTPDEDLPADAREYYRQSQNQ